MKLVFLNGTLLSLVDYTWNAGSEVPVFDFNIKTEGHRPDTVDIVDIGANTRATYDPRRQVDGQLTWSKLQTILDDIVGAIS